MVKRKVHIDQEVAEILVSMSWEDNGGQVIGRIVYQLDRKMYLRVNKVLAALGGKWNRRLKGHVFPYDPRPKIAEAAGNGHLEVIKDGYFPTPPDVAAMMVKEVLYKFEIVTPRILEPSAGEGHLALFLCQTLSVPPSSIDVIEINPKRRKILAGHGFSVRGDDFLRRIWGEYDVILMNPPFEAGQDVEHVLHARDHLAEDGVLVSVMGSGVTFRTDAKYRMFRELAEDEGKIIPLPPGSFKASGTNVNAVLVVLYSVPKPW